jgi:hypothetical protein
MEISDIRRRFRAALDTARKQSEERRARADLAVTAYNAFLRDVAVPVFRMFANVAKAEGHAFTVFTPGDGVRLSSDRHASDFIEIGLDHQQDPPRVVTRINRQRGRDIQTREGVLVEGRPLNSLTDEDVLAFLLSEIGTLVER